MWISIIPCLIPEDVKIPTCQAREAVSNRQVVVGIQSVLLLEVLAVGSLGPVEIPWEVWELEIQTLTNCYLLVSMGLI